MRVMIAAVLGMALACGLGSGEALAADKHHRAKAAPPTGQRVSLLGGKWVFYLPKVYEKNPMPEIDEKARAAGVVGSLYLDKAAHRVVIVTETPLPQGGQVSSNDSQTLDGITGDVLKQQQGSYGDFKKLGEKKMVRRGLGLRQLDIAGNVEGGRVISTTLSAASGTRTAMVNVISLEKDRKDHTARVTAISNNKK